eukprot:323970-Pleurochrysis_carterae.AAC.1
MPRNHFGFSCNVVVGLGASSIGHPAAVHVQYQIHSVSIRVFFVEVAGVERRLREALGLHKLLLCRAVPDSSCISLAVQGLQQLPDDRDTAIIEEVFVGWR